MGPSRMTAAQKVEVATAHVEAKQQEMEDAKRAAEKLVDTLKAVLEEV